MKKVAKVIAIKAAKSAVGGCAAIAIAAALGLQYAPSAGLITLLSLQDTKKETLVSVAQRFLSFLPAAAIAYACFGLLGYNLWAFGVYLLLFVALCHAFSTANAIVMCSVLVTHFWIEQSMSLVLFLNELLLILIGAGVGVLINLFLPAGLSTIKSDQREIDGLIRRILTAIADALDEKGEKELTELPVLQRKLAQARQRADIGSNNALTINLRYYVEYIDMRKNQYMVLERIQTALHRLEVIPAQAKELADYLRYISANFAETNDGVRLMRYSEEMLEHFRKSSLPQTRQEFEARAILLQIFNEITHLLLLKNTFVQSLSGEQKKLFWSIQQAGSSSSAAE